MTRRRTAVLLAVVAATWSLLATPPPVAAQAGRTNQRVDLVPTLHPATAGATRSQITLWANGSATDTVWFTSRTFRIVFGAETTWCDGPARLQVRVDGELLMDRPVAEAGAYAVVGDWAAGEHHLSFRFTNDHRTAACDRNLHIDRDVRLTGTGDPTGEVPSARRIVSVSTESDLGHATVSPVTAGRVGLLRYDGADGFWRAELWGAGTLAVDLDAQGDNLLLYGWVESCDGPPEIEVRVDGQVVYTGPSSDGTSLRIGDVFGPGSPLLHTVEIELVNPHRGDGCQRRVRLDWIRFHGWV